MNIFACSSLTDLGEQQQGCVLGGIGERSEPDEGDETGIRDQ